MRPQKGLHWRSWVGRLMLEWFSKYSGVPLSPGKLEKLHAQGKPPIFSFLSQVRLLVIQVSTECLNQQESSSLRQLLLIWAAVKELRPRYHTGHLKELIGFPNS